MQDIEFTVQEERLWMLQCRAGKRTGKGAVKIAVDMVGEGLVEKSSAIKMVEPQHLDQLLHPQVQTQIFIFFFFHSHKLDVETKIRNLLVMIGSLEQELMGLRRLGFRSKSRDDCLTRNR